MKVVFGGTSDFAVSSLEHLIASAHEVLAVVTQPDRPKGRGREMQISKVKQVALAHSLPLLQPEKIGAPESIAELKAYGDIGAFVVVAYGQLITPELLAWPKYGVVNVHGSILPKYRGAAPIQQAIISGESQTGVSTMLMDEGWDTGDILLQEAVDIDPKENAAELSNTLAVVGARLLVLTLDGLESGTVTPIPQDNDLASVARSLKRDAGAIDWSLPAPTVVNLIRGCTPKPGAFTHINDTMVKVWNATVDQQGSKQGEPGEIVESDKHGIVVAAGNGSVRLLEVQPASRQRMAASDFARGSSISKGTSFDVRFQMT